MKIYTKGGDKGETSLFGGARLPKNHVRIEAYGSVDELNAFIGLLGDGLSDAAMKAQLKQIQSILFSLGSNLAADPSKDNLWLPKFGEGEIKDLENWIDNYDKDLAPLKHFILPGGHASVSHAHICRTICRRAERNCISLMQQESGVKVEWISYLNRLSDYFFILSRKIAFDLGIEEHAWMPRKAD